MEIILILAQRFTQSQLRALRDVLIFCRNGIEKIYQRQRNKQRDSLTCGKQFIFGWKEWGKKSSAQFDAVETHVALSSRTVSSSWTTVPNHCEMSKPPHFLRNKSKLYLENIYQRERNKLRDSLSCKQTILFWLKKVAKTYGAQFGAVETHVVALSSRTVSFSWTFSNHTGNVIASRFSSQQTDVSTCGEESVLTFKSRSEQRIKDYTLHWIWPVGRKVRILIPIIHFLCKKGIIVPIFFSSGSNPYL